jgi:hypothetical protein
MSKLFRRSWQMQKTGRNGAVTAVQTAKSGTFRITGASFSSPASAIEVVSGTITSADVGRKLRLEWGNDTVKHRYDGLYVIHSVSSSLVTLRKNHNVTGTPDSIVRLYENTPTGPEVLGNWYVPESCTFQTDAAGDIETFYPGSFVTISKTVNADNRGQWLISHRVDSQTVILSKSYIHFSSDHTNDARVKTTDPRPFVTEASGIWWHVQDRVAVHMVDFFELFVQALVDMGWAFWQHRGRNSLGSLNDIVLRSRGETNSTIENGKLMYLRVTSAMNTRNAASTFNRNSMTFNIFHHWEPTITTNNSPGGAVGGIQCGGISTTTNDTYLPNSHCTYSSAPFCQMTGFDLSATGPNGYPLETRYLSYAIFGDCDEVTLAVDDSVTDNSFNDNGTRWAGYFGYLKTMGANPNVFTVKAPVASGTAVAINIGTSDPTTCVPPYQVGDNISIIGYKTTSPTTSPSSVTAAEYIETTTIQGFDLSDSSNKKIIVTTLAGSYGNGPEDLKAQVGEDVYPVYLDPGGYPYMHNVARTGNATTYDYQARGFTATGAQAATLLDVDPNPRTFRWGLSPHYWKVGGEFRGRQGTVMRSSQKTQGVGTRWVDKYTDDIYVAIRDYSNTDHLCAGPMTKAMAGIWE